MDVRDMFLVLRFVAAAGVCGCSCGSLWNRREAFLSLEHEICTCFE